MSVFRQFFRFRLRQGYGVTGRRDISGIPAASHFLCWQLLVVYLYSVVPATALPIIEDHARLKLVEMVYPKGIKSWMNHENRKYRSTHTL